MIDLIGNSTNIINWKQFESQLPNYTDDISVVSLEKSVAIHSKGFDDHMCNLA
jgi:hypothetical protein